MPIEDDIDRINAPQSTMSAPDKVSDDDEYDDDD